MLLAHRMLRPSLSCSHSWTFSSPLRSGTTCSLVDFPQGLGLQDPEFRPPRHCVFVAWSSSLHKEVEDPYPSLP